MVFCEEDIVNRLCKVLIITGVISLLCIGTVGCSSENTPAESTTPTAATTPTESAKPTASATPTTPLPTTGFTLSVEPNRLEGDNRFVTWIHVFATYPDGSREEVTKQCTWVSTNDMIAYVITEDAPGEDEYHPPVPGWYVVGAFPGGAIITLTYEEDGFTASCDLPVNVLFMMP
jgi:hypothetical protein